MGKINKTSVALWTIQGLMAALFLFAGVMKLVMPYDPEMSMGFPHWFLLFIGVAETAGALGLVLPGMTGIRTELTALAAAGLVVIMAGAAIVCLGFGSYDGAAIPAVIGALCAVVAYKRSEIRVRETAPQPA